MEEYWYVIVFALASWFSGILRRLLASRNRSKEDAKKVVKERSDSETKPALSREAPVEKGEETPAHYRGKGLPPEVFEQKGVSFENAPIRPS